MVNIMGLHAAAQAGLFNKWRTMFVYPKTILHTIIFNNPIGPREENITCANSFGLR